MRDNTPVEAHRCILKQFTGGSGIEVKGKIDPAVQNIMGVIGAYIFNGKYIIICDNLQQGRDLEPVGNIFEARGGQGSQPFYIISVARSAL